MHANVRLIGFPLESGRAESHPSRPLSGRAGVDPIRSFNHLAPISRSGLESGPQAWRNLTENQIVSF